jgi:hypothetical protein
MSKPIARVVFAVLISLVIIATVAASPIVQSRLGSAFRKAELNASEANSMFTDNETLTQGTVNEKIPAPSQYNDFAPDSSHHCNSDPSLDY